MFRADSYEEDHEISIFNAIQLANASKDRELIQFLVNPQVLGILSVTGRRSMTVNDISHHLGLPLATCYKLVEQMVELGLMARVGTTRTSSRGRAANYTSSLKSVSLRMADMNIEAVVTWKNGQMESFRREFRLAATDNESLIIEHRGAFNQMGQL